MISLLSKLFIKDRENIESTAVRQAYGTLCSIVGIVLNIFLFSFKYFAGTISGSIAITADAFNNLSDAGSSVITLVGFRFAGSKPDSGHPFGHGRYEYVSGFIVSIIIILMAFELGKSSVGKILHPESVEGGALVTVILIVSVCIKLYMFLYNRLTGRKISSASLEATSMDSISDCAATTVVLISNIVSRFTSLSLDGWGGAAVSLFILYTGINAARTTLSPLLGQAPSDKLVKSIEDVILEHEEIVGVHDLMIHDYGPGHTMISIHCEVSGSEDIYELHNTIEHIEDDLREKLGCEAVIHMDPVDIDNEEVNKMRIRIGELAAQLDESLSIHDFRMQYDDTGKQLVFDLVLPPDFKRSPTEIEDEIKSLISSHYPEYGCIIKLEQSYV